MNVSNNTIKPKRLKQKTMNSVEFWIHKNLAWNEHTKCLVQKLSQTNGIFGKLRNFTTKKVLLSIYYANILV